MKRLHHHAAFHLCCGVVAVLVSFKNEAGNWFAEEEPAAAADLRQAFKLINFHEKLAGLLLRLV